MTAFYGMVALRQTYENLQDVPSPWRQEFFAVLNRDFVAFFIPYTLLSEM